jgi:hypothetical protein
MFRIPVVLLGFGAALVLAPASRAQSEVAPDHFDGNDSWAAQAASKAQAPTPKTKQPGSAIQAQGKTSGIHAVANNLSKPQQAELVAIQDKRKTSARKANQQ